MFHITNLEWNYRNKAPFWSFDFFLIIQKLQRLRTKIDAGDKDCFDPTGIERTWGKKDSRKSQLSVNNGFNMKFDFLLHQLAFFEQIHRTFHNIWSLFCILFIFIQHFNLSYVIFYVAAFFNIKCITVKKRKYKHTNNALEGFFVMEMKLP